MLTIQGKPMRSAYLSLLLLPCCGRTSDRSCIVVVWVSSILNNLDGFQSDQTTFHRFIKEREKSANFFIGIHYFDDHGQVHGQPQNFCSVQDTGFAKTQGAAKDGRAGELQFAGF